VPLAGAFLPPGLPDAAAGVPSMSESSVMVRGSGRGLAPAEAPLALPPWHAAARLLPVPALLLGPASSCAAASPSLSPSPCSPSSSSLSDSL
jgi:hypothetical protein